jgi:integrase
VTDPTEMVRISAASLADLRTLADTARGYVASAKAPATVRAYRSDWRAFSGWCADHGLDSLPAAPETVALYLTDQAGVLAVATMQRRLTSISQAHKAAGYDSPTHAAIVRETWKGIRRTFGVASRGKQALLTDDIRAMVATLDPGRLIGVRDRALILLGFAGAFRRGELAALDVADVTDTPDGLVVLIRRSKTDQEAAGQTIGVPYGSDPATCPVRALRAWLEAAAISDGPIFRHVDRHGILRGERISGRAAAARVKVAAAAAGHDPDRVGGHSLRAGLITSAVMGGATERDTMRHSRHRSIAVFRGYVRDVGLFDTNAAAKAGL